MSELSEKILSLLTQQGVSYGELSKRTGIPKSALQRYATGLTPKIPAERIQLIASALGVSPESLIGWPDKGEEEQLENVYFNFAREAQQNEIDPEDIRAAIDMIKRLRGK